MAGENRVCPLTQQPTQLPSLAFLVPSHSATHTHFLVSGHLNHRRINFAIYTIQEGPEIHIHLNRFYF